MSTMEILSNGYMEQCSNTGILLGRLEWRFFLAQLKRKSFFSLVIKLELFGTLQVLMCKLYNAAWPICMKPSNQKWCIETLNQVTYWSTMNSMQRFLISALQNCLGKGRAILPPELWALLGNFSYHETINYLPYSFYWFTYLWQVRGSRICQLGSFKWKEWCL